LPPDTPQPLYLVPEMTGSTSTSTSTSTCIHTYTSLLPSSSHSTIIMGTGTVARPLPAPRQRPATPPNPDSKSIDAKPPAKRQRRAPKPKPGKRSGRPKKIPPIKVGLLSLPAEIIGRIASFLLPPTINVQDGFLPPWELPYGGLRSKTPRAKIKEYRFGGIPSGVRDVLNLARTCRKCESGVGLVIGKIGDGKSDGKKRYDLMVVD
jgi:hypothetical protein